MEWKEEDNQQDSKNDPKLTWKCSLDTQRASCLNSGTWTVANSLGSRISMISSSSFKNITYASKTKCPRNDKKGSRQENGGERTKKGVAESWLRIIERKVKQNRQREVASKIASQCCSGHWLQISMKRPARLLKVQQKPAHSIYPGRMLSWCWLTSFGLWTLGQNRSKPNITWAAKDNWQCCGEWRTKHQTNKIDTSIHHNRLVAWNNPEP